jgi:hypothetical protein
MIKKMSTKAGSLLAAALLVMSGSATANLIFDSSVVISGAGLGAVNTLVTVHDPGGSGNNNGTESGCTVWTGAATVFTPCLNGVAGGDNQAENNTFLLSDPNLGLTAAGNLAAVVNVAETGQDLQVTLTHLYFALYNPTTGALLATYSYAGGPLVLNQGTGTGTGGAGFVFVLDAAQAAAANALCPVLSSCRLGGGLQFANGSTSDGNETFFVVNVPRAQAPEPGTSALLGLSLAGLAALRRRGQGKGQAS